MVDSVDLAKYSEITGNIENKECISKDILDTCDDVLLFFSFDIVNSSLYKTINYYGWSMVIDHILQQIRNYVKTTITRAEVWRVFGDEVIFIVKIYERESVFEYIESIYEILSYYCNSIDNGSMFEKIDGMEGYSDVVTELMKLQDVISLQACAWLATVTDKKEIKDNKHSKFVENIFEVIEESENNRFYEFMGIDIDTGFRLTELTRAKRLTVSFELAYLLSEEKEYIKKLNIMTYCCSAD